MVMQMTKDEFQNYFGSVEYHVDVAAISSSAMIKKSSELELNASGVAPKEEVIQPELQHKMIDKGQYEIMKDNMLFSTLNTHNACVLEKSSSYHHSQYIFNVNDLQKTSIKNQRNEGNKDHYERVSKISSED
jgi:hypothetical protein